MACDLASHLAGFLKAARDVSAIERSAVPAAASSFILDHYPPGMHRKHRTPTASLSAEAKAGIDCHPDDVFPHAVPSRLRPGHQGFERPPRARRSSPSSPDQADGDDHGGPFPLFAAVRKRCRAASAPTESRKPMLVASALREDMCRVYKAHTTVLPPMPAPDLPDLRQNIWTS